jgi:hypothetical protein
MTILRREIHSDYRLLWQMRSPKLGLGAGITVRLTGGPAMRRVPLFSFGTSGLRLYAARLLESRKVHHEGR